MLGDARLREVFEGAAETHHMVGAALGLDHAGATAFSAYGVAALDGGVAVDPHTRFPIASVTKPMVAAAIARLVAQGALGLEDSVARHVPEVAGSDWAEAATVRHLLANLSGLTLRIEREFAFGGDDDALAELTAAIAADPPATPPGAAWSYGNSGWGVLGHVVERVTGERWEDAMSSLLFSPLGLDDTAFTAAGVSRATTYQWTGVGHEPAGEWTDRGCGPGGAGLLSSAADLLRFGRALLDDADLVFLRDEHAAVAFPWFLDAWCLGLARFEWDGVGAYGWDGIGAGARAVLRVVPERDAVIVLLSNTSTGRALYRAVLPEVLDEALGVSMPAPPLAGTAGDLARYAGTYAWPDRTLLVEAVDGALMISDSGAGTTRTVRPLDDRNFLGDPDHPDGDTYSFSCFDVDGRPQMAHRLVWGFPRRS